MFVLAIVIAVAAWLLGPKTLPTRTQTRVLAFVRSHEMTLQSSPVARFAARQHTAPGVQVFTIGFAVVAGLSGPTPVPSIIVAVLVVVGIPDRVH
jgi:hypothetical protein